MRKKLSNVKSRLRGDLGVEISWMRELVRV